MAENHRLAVMISGSGTTMCAVQQAIKLGVIPGLEIGLCIASQRGITGIDRARALGLHPIVLNPAEFESEESFAQALLDAMNMWRIDMFAQLGWLPKTPRQVVAAFPGRCLNQHPAPPEYFGGYGMYGIRPHAAVLRFHQLSAQTLGRWGDFWTEVVAQAVATDYDQGQALVRTRVPVYFDDTPERLQSRALPFEWATVISALQVLTDPTLPLSPPSGFIIAEDEGGLLAEAKQWALEQYPVRKAVGYIAKGGRHGQKRCSDS